MSIDWTARRVVFLDVDGVLNGHEWLHIGGVRISPACVAVANRLFAELGAVAVISSSWRALVARGRMDCEGLATLFATHGCEFPVVAVLPGVDHTAAAKSAGILEFVAQHKPGPWLAIDDADLALPPGRLVRTDGHQGLLPFFMRRVRDAFAAIEGASCPRGST